jgi:hypothetical protein
MEDYFAVAGGELGRILIIGRQMIQISNEETGSCPQTI